MRNCAVCRQETDEQWLSTFERNDAGTIKRIGVCLDCLDEAEPISGEWDELLGERIEYNGVWYVRQTI